jgi:hypothetical protein
MAGVVEVAVAAKMSMEKCQILFESIEISFVHQQNEYLTILVQSHNKITELLKESRTFGALTFTFPVCKGVVFFDVDARDCIVAWMQ